MFSKFDRNKKLILFNNVQNNVVNFSQNSIVPYINPTLLNKHILNRINENNPKVLKIATKNLESLKYTPNQDLDIQLDINDVCDTSTSSWLGLDEMFVALKPRTKIGKKELKKQFMNPSTDLNKIQQSQHLIQSILSNGDGFIAHVRSFLSSLVIPDESESFEGIIRTAQLFSKVSQFIKQYFNNSQLFSELSQEQLQNDELFNNIFNTINFENVKENECRAYWFNETAECVVLIEEWEQNQRQFEYLHHDMKRRTSPQIILDKSNKVFQIIKNQCLKNIPNASITKYTKSDKFFTTTGLIELFATEEQIKEKINNYADTIKAEWPKFQTTALFTIIKKLDIASTFSLYVAEKNPRNWSVPSNVREGFDFYEMFHPNIPNCVPNNFKNNSNTTLLSGFNSSGKSTVLRTIGMCAYLNQIGMLIPAKTSQIQIFKKICKRAGANDDLANHQSTFTQQMTEIAFIIQKDNLKDNLVLLDELGSNTNESEGFALAVAVLNRLSCSGAVSLFATHFNIETIQKTIPKSVSFSLTQSHQCVPYLQKYQSNGWDFAKSRGFIN